MGKLKYSHEKKRRSELIKVCNIDSLLIDLHSAEGSHFIGLLREITNHPSFFPLRAENSIYTTGGESSDDYDNLLNVARKAVKHGYRVFILPNPKGFRTADFIFERKGVYKMFDLKAIVGKSSVGNRLKESIGQTNRVLLNMTKEYSTRLLASDIKSYFEDSTEALEVLIFKGNKSILIDRRIASHPLFYRFLKKKCE